MKTFMKTSLTVIKPINMPRVWMILALWMGQFSTHWKRTTHKWVPTLLQMWAFKNTVISNNSQTTVLQFGYKFKTKKIKNTTSNMTSLPSWKHKAHRTKPQNPRPNDFQHAYSRNVAFSTNVEHSSANNLFSSKQIACPHQMNFRRIEFTSLLS